MPCSIMKLPRSKSCTCLSKITTPSYKRASILHLPGIDFFFLSFSIREIDLIRQWLCVWQAYMCFQRPDGVGDLTTHLYSSMYGRNKCRPDPEFASDCADISGRPLKHERHSNIIASDWNLDPIGTALWLNHYNYCQVMLL